MKLKRFRSHDFGELRALIKNDGIWFVANDVAKALGYARPRKAVQDHIDAEDKKLAPIKDYQGKVNKAVIINESGLYSMILKSRLITSKKFKRWVTSEVLPTIKKNEMYDRYKILDKSVVTEKVVIEIEQEKERNKALIKRMFEDMPYTELGKSIAQTYNKIIIKELVSLNKCPVIIGNNALEKDNRKCVCFKKKCENENSFNQKYIEKVLYLFK